MAKFLFVHQNFPGQYRHLARQLAANPNNQVVFLTQHDNQIDIPGVNKLLYRPHRTATQGQHHYLVDTETALLNVQAVARAALALKSTGFIPDAMLGHNGWGEIWFLKDVFPNTPLLGYFEFFYHSEGADVGFDPEERTSFDQKPKLRCKNIGNLLGLNTVDMGQCPTQWQRSLYPACYQPKLHIAHEGIDTTIVKPDAQASFHVPNTNINLSLDDEVITYVSRNLEPYRGFPSFMRSLPTILGQRPNAHVLIVGGDDTSYQKVLTNPKQNLERLDLWAMHPSLEGFASPSSTFFYATSDRSNKLIMKKAINFNLLINSKTILCSFVFLVLSCSPDNKSVVKTNSKVTAEKSVSAEEPNEVLEESSEDIPIAVESEESLTQSEKNDFAEDIKISEEKAKDLIEKFDKNIDSKSIRDEAKAQFKQMLPGYKEKMIQVGKAKLIERANEEAIGN